MIDTAPHQDPKEVIKSGRCLKCTAQLRWNASIGEWVHQRGSECHGDAEAARDRDDLVVLSAAALSGLLANGGKGDNAMNGRIAVACAKAALEEINRAG